MGCRRVPGRCQGQLRAGLHFACSTLHRLTQPTAVGHSPLLQTLATRGRPGGALKGSMAAPSCRCVAAHDSVAVDTRKSSQGYANFPACSRSTCAVGHHTTCPHLTWPPSMCPPLKIQPVQEAVLKRCLAAEPRYGERWQRVAKDPASAHQKPEAILKRVVADLDKPL